MARKNTDDPHSRAKQVMQTPGHQLDSLMTTPDEAETLLAALVAYGNTLPTDSIEARMVASRLDQVRLSVNLRWHVVADEPLSGGHQQGKRILTFADGTKAIFKPAWGEGGRHRKPVGDHT
jgi:protein gp37